MQRNRISLLTITCALVAAAAAHAQTSPIQSFQDPESSAVCNLVNASNVELIVVAETGQLQIVTGSDSPLPGSLVTADGTVLIDGDPRGFIGFLEDGDGERRLWWLTASGLLVRVDGFTLAISEDSVGPADFTDVSCEAGALFDGCLQNSDCDDNNVCTTDTCSLTSGACVFEPILFCGNDNPNPTVNFVCGAGSMTAMIGSLLILGFVSTKPRRR